MEEAKVTPPEPVATEKAHCQPFQTLATQHSSSSVLSFYLFSHVPDHLCGTGPHLGSFGRMNGLQMLCSLAVWAHGRAFKPTAKGRIGNVPTPPPFTTACEGTASPCSHPYPRHQFMFSHLFPSRWERGQSLTLHHSSGSKGSIFPGVFITGTCSCSSSYLSTSPGRCFCLWDLFAALVDSAPHFGQRCSCWGQRACSVFSHGCVWPGPLCVQHAQRPVCQLILRVGCVSPCPLGSCSHPTIIRARLSCLAVGVGRRWGWAGGAGPA